MSRWIVGVDFGRQADRTAIVCVQTVDDPDGGKPFLDVRHLERLRVGMSYPSQVSRLVALLDDTEELAGAQLIVDSTGVGVAVSDILKEQLRRPFISLTITGGNAASTTGREWSVPKRDLISRLAVAMQSRRVRVPAGMPESEALLEELGRFGVSISGSGNDSYGARSGHDDLVLALSYAVWVADRPSSSRAYLELLQRRVGEIHPPAPPSVRQLVDGKESL